MVEEEASMEGWLRMPVLKDISEGCQDASMVSIDKLLRGKGSSPPAILQSGGKRNRE